ncbi:hypothetical protein ACJJTC_017846 [Scirpophaga incertulas]
MLVTVILYTVVGVFGFLKYDKAVKASVTLNLPHHEKKAQAAKITIALAIFLSFPLQNFVAYNIVWCKIRKRVKPGASAFCADYTLRIALVLLPWALGLAMPRLGPFIALFGAFCLSLLAIVFPGLMDACLWWPGEEGRGPTQCVRRMRLTRDIIIIVIGLLCLGSGVYTSMIEIIESWHH